jgi:hypothetical protein
VGGGGGGGFRLLLLLVVLLLAELVEAGADLVVGGGEGLVVVGEGEYFHFEVVVFELFGLVLVEGASVLVPPLLVLLGEVFDAVGQRLLAGDDLREAARHRLHDLAAEFFQLLLQGRTWAVWGGADEGLQRCGNLSFHLVAEESKRAGRRLLLWKHF